MTRNHPAAPADACSPDADRAGPDARIPEWCAHLLALIIRFILLHLHGADRRCSRFAARVHDRPDLPPGSAQALAASIRGTFGTAIAWMCLRRGIGPGHPDWPELSRAIVAFGGSLSRFRPGLPACGLQWWENPHVVPGMIGETPATPAATALALCLARPAAGSATPPASEAVHATPCRTPLPASRRPGRRPLASSARGSTGPPPQGPPHARTVTFPTPDARGRSMAGPAVLIRAA